VIVNGIDGTVVTWAPDWETCCPPDVCSYSPDAFACNFINLLPNGPIWDEAKQAGIGCPSWCDTGCPDDLCGSMVAYAAFMGRRLHAMVSEHLWPSIRESSPYTAYDTLDEWLARLNWRDCYMGTCRLATLGEQTPYETLGECGLTFCPPTFPDDLARLYKRGVVVALHRMRLRPVRNLAALNFVLEHLHCELVPDPSYNPNNPDSTQCLLLRPIRDAAPAIAPDPCPRPDESASFSDKMVTLYLTPGNGVCAGAPSRVYPLTLAAHCIVLALLPSCETICVKRIP